VYALSHGFEEVEDDVYTIKRSVGNEDPQIWEEQEAKRWKQAEMDFVNIEVESTGTLLELFVIGRNIAVQLCFSTIIPILIVPANIILFFILLLQNTSIFTKQSYFSVVACLFTITMVLVSVDGEILELYKNLLASVAVGSFRLFLISLGGLMRSLVLFDKGAVIMSLLGDFFGLRVVMSDGRWGYIPWKMYLSRGAHRLIQHLLCDSEFNWLSYICSFITLIIGLRGWYDSLKIKAENEVVMSDQQQRNEAKEK
jgi:hypothetical protein